MIKVEEENVYFFFLEKKEHFLTETETIHKL